MTLHANQAGVPRVVSANDQYSSVGEFDVLFVNTFQKLGGAARAAYRIFSEISNRSVRTHYLTLIKEDSNLDISGHLYTDSIFIPNDHRCFFHLTFGRIHCGSVSNASKQDWFICIG
jgi:hypothetical protein